MADYQTPFAVLLRDAHPCARDMIGREESITFRTRGDTPTEFTPVVLSVKTVEGTEEAAEYGQEQRRRVEVGIVPTPGQSMAEAQRWVFAEWRGLQWRVVQPPLHVHDSVTIYQLELISKADSPARTARERG